MVFLIVFLLIVRDMNLWQIVSAIAILALSYRLEP